MLKKQFWPFHFAHFFWLYYSNFYLSLKCSGWGGDSVRHLTHITNSDDLLLTPGRKAELITKAQARRMLVAHLKKEKVLSFFSPHPFCFLQQITLYTYLKRKRNHHPKKKKKKACAPASIFHPVVPLEMHSVRGTEARCTVLAGNVKEGIFCSNSF